MLAVAVSGGVDSLYALYHYAGMARAGEEPVLALHGRFLPYDENNDPVPGLEANCRILGVPLVVAEMSEAFSEGVVRPFMESYVRGHTPNPCVLCNARIKFGLLLEIARQNGADRLVTGHYARLAEHPCYGLALGAAEDGLKDQSYFLALIPRERLASAVFPLARRRKAELRAELDAAGLTVPVPKESQEICFVPNADYRSFLHRQGVELPGGGPIFLSEPCEASCQTLEASCQTLEASCQTLEASCQTLEASCQTLEASCPPARKQLGQHEGLWRYTEGQRRGLGIAWSEPLYVVSKNIANNTLLVGPQEALFVQGCTAGDINLLVPAELWPEQLLVRTRYRQSAAPARVCVSNDKLLIHFVDPHSRPAPGQLAAVYDSEGFVLGGGIIETCHRVCSQTSSFDFQLERGFTLRS